MQSRAWHNLVPDFNHTVVTAGYGTFNNTSSSGGGNDYVTTARTGDGRLAMAHVPSTGTGTGTLTVNMAWLSVNPVSTKWYNPANGTYTTIGTFANNGSRTSPPPATTARA